MPLLLFLFYSFWVPQIVMCVADDVRQPLRPEFVLGTSAARLALPLYIYACPTNLLRVAPAPGLCAALVAWVGLQAGLLLLQQWLGPRCFIPDLVRSLAGCTREEVLRLPSSGPAPATPCLDRPLPCAPPCSCCPGATTMAGRCRRRCVAAGATPATAH